MDKKTIDLRRKELKEWLTIISDLFDNGYLSKSEYWKVWESLQLIDTIYTKHMED